MMARGHSVEYFIEGGRSRTGRLLPPKTGMLSMTVRSYLSDPQRPVVFMPVYFAYERIFEARDYVSELSGRPKQKESLLGLLSALPKLKRRFGRVYVSFGQPLPLGELLEAEQPNWRDARRSEARPAWLTAFVGKLASRIEQRINAAAAVSPVALLSTALLAMPRQAMAVADLERQLALYQRLLTLAPGGDEAWTTAQAPHDIIAYCLRLGFIARISHPLGDIVQMTGSNAILCTYPRNNVLHLFALPSLLACAFLDSEDLTTEELHRLSGRVYPYIAEELCLAWSETELPAIVLTLLGLFVELGLLTGSVAEGRWRRPAAGSAQAMQLSVLAHATLPVVQRYYLVISALLEAGSGTISQAMLEGRCQMMASRIAVLYEFASPEFSDRALFRAFIDLLRGRGVIAVGQGGLLTYGEVLEAVATDARRVLGEQIRHSILQVTHS
jgi:glycerol-3-phosphate O-acyltransferase